MSRFSKEEIVIALANIMLVVIVIALYFESALPRLATVIGCGLAGYNFYDVWEPSESRKNAQGWANDLFMLFILGWLLFSGHTAPPVVTLCLTITYVLNFYHHVDEWRPI